MDSRKFHVIKSTTQSETSCRVKSSKMAKCYMNFYEETNKKIKNIRNYIFNPNFGGELA